MNYTIHCEADFTEAVTAINASRTAGTYRISLAADITAAKVILAATDVERAIVIGSLAAGDANRRVIANGADADLVTVESGNTLVLDDNFTLNGNGKEAYVARVNEGGTLLMKAGSHIEGAADGGVVVRGGVFEMTGGEISGNRAFACGGGGVLVEGGAFKMAGGEISGNTARFGGGGVCINDGVFEMAGGEISGNTADDGGGVCVLGVFEMAGGGIWGNTASSGGGVSVDGGTFTMEGGEISKNTAHFGGGVCVEGDGTFIKNGGGIIGGNKAENGKAACVNSSPAKKREGDAGPGVDMDSGKDGSAGGWEERTEGNFYQPKDQMKWVTMVRGWLYFVPKLKKGMGFFLPIKNPEVISGDIPCKSVLMFDLIPGMFKCFDADYKGKVFVVLMTGDADRGNQWNLVKLLFEDTVDKEEAFTDHIYGNLIKELPENWKNTMGITEHDFTKYSEGSR